MILGTAAYMSPEQAKGRPVDKRADIWAFGCVVFEILAGRRPFAGDDFADILTSIMRDSPAFTDNEFRPRPVSFTASVACERRIVRGAQRIRLPAPGQSTAVGLEQYEHLRALGCDFGQGFLIARPLDARGAAELIAGDRIFMPECSPAAS